MMAAETFEIRNRWTNAVQFTATTEVTPDMTPRVKLGLAVKWGRQNNADLRGADLSGAYLRGANLRNADLSDADLSDADLRDVYLSGADLSGAYLRNADLRNANLSDADLSDADLRGAYLSDVDLRSYIADLWMILSMARAEVPSLITALREGRVDGSTYSGECACLVGSLENAGATGLPHAASSPAEQWFTMIREGDKPGDDSAGGFASGKALEWALDYCAKTGIEVPA